MLEESRAYADLDVYYKSCFQYGALDSEQFFTALRLARQTVFLPTARTHDLYGNVSEAVLLVIPFRKSSSTFRGHRVFYFDKKLMEKNFAPLMESGASYVCLRAADGTTLMELGEPALRPDQIPENAATLGHTSVPPRRACSTCSAAARRAAASPCWRRSQTACSSHETPRCCCRWAWASRCFCWLPRR